MSSISNCSAYLKKTPNLTPILVSLSTYSTIQNTYTTVVVKGYNFFPNNTFILFGNSPLSVSFLGSNGVSFVVPANAMPGNYEIEAVNTTNFYPLYPISITKSNKIMFAVLK